MFGGNPGRDRVPLVPGVPLGTTEINSLLLEVRLFQPGTPES